MKIFSFRNLIVASSLVLSASAFGADAPDCSRKVGSLPNPEVAAGTPNRHIPIQHILVMMQENHSFDSYYGALNQKQFYGDKIDGVSSSHTNLDATGKPVAQFLETNLCLADTDHSWNGEHNSWDNGKNDKFVAINGTRTMAYYDQSQITYYYAIANHFAVADRYFCPVLTSTYTNRFFLYAGTAFGHIKNDNPSDPTQFSQKTIFDVLTQYGISWKYYTDDIGYLSLFQPMYNRNLDKMGKIADYMSDLKNDTLPQVVFIDSDFEGQDEHPAANVQLGEAFIAQNINALISSKSWKKSAVFLTYDENGGFYDHVAPPKACIPDDTPPNLSSSNVPGKYDNYGFRVPFTLVSPYAKHHYVSHHIYDHTSILKFIETKFNLPALSARDANADGMHDLFNYEHPKFDVPQLPTVVVPTTTCTPTGG